MKKTFSCLSNLWYVYFYEIYWIFKELIQFFSSKNLVLHISVFFYFIESFTKKYFEPQTNLFIYFEAIPRWHVYMFEWIIIVT